LWARHTLAATIAWAALGYGLSTIRADDTPSGATVGGPVFEGANVRLQWNSAGDLQVGPSPQGPWTTIAVPPVRQSAATIPAIDMGARFFRIVEKGIPGEPQPIVQGDPHKPFRVSVATVRKANVSGGNCLLEVRLRPGQNAPPVFPLLQDGDILVLRDDGTAGDAKAGDGVYSSAFTIDLEDLKASNEFFKSLPSDFKVQGTFGGRTLEEENGFSSFDTDAFDRGEAVQIFPSPFEGFLPASLTSGAPAGPGASHARKSLKNFGDTTLVTNIVFLTNIVSTNIIIGTHDTFQTNIDCRPFPIDQPPLQVVTNICLTNFTPGTKFVFATNVVCNTTFLTNVLVLTNGLGTNIVIDPGTTNIVVTNKTDNPRPPGTSGDVTFTNPPPDIVLVTNVVTVELCATNVVIVNDPGNPVPVIDCKEEIILIPRPPIISEKCLTNIVIHPGDPIFTNIFVTNIITVTNVVTSGDPTGGGGGGGIVITNFDGDIIIKVDGKPPGQGGLLTRPTFWQKSLLITDLSVVDDLSRTFDPCTGRGTKMGAWTFGRLMTDIANPAVTGIDASDFVRRWLRTWQKDQLINYDTATNRNVEIIAQVINDWQVASGGEGRPLDLSIAPFRLLAIANRLDLRGNPGYGGVNTDDPCTPTSIGGEGRFVFCLIPNAFGGGGNGGGTGYPGTGGGAGTNSNCGAGQYTVIFEYAVPKRTCDEIKSFGLEWYNLSQMEFGAGFNAALQHITDQFATAGADPSRKPNQSALSQLRSNDLLREPWELREWRFFATDSDAGWLRPVTVKKTPSIVYNFDSFLVNYITANASQILAESHTVPLQWGSPGQPYLGGVAPMSTANFFWDGPGPAGSSLPTEVRHKFSLNTCNGCHAGETGTPFTHVFPRAAGQEAALSDFLTGKNMPKIDPADGHTQRWFADLKRREDDLLHLVTEPCFFQLFKDPAPFIH
jgi:hypothetical protein